MAEAHSRGANLTDAQFDAFDGINDFREQIVAARVNMLSERRFVSPAEVRKIATENTLTVSGLGTAVAKCVNKVRCPGGRPNATAQVVYDEKYRDQEVGFEVSCQTTCLRALTSQCPLSRLSRFVDDELDGQRMQAKIDAVEVKDWLAA